MYSIHVVGTLSFGRATTLYIVHYSKSGPIPSDSYTWSVNHTQYKIHWYYYERLWVGILKGRYINFCWLLNLISSSHIIMLITS